jgi:hypothetical protein
LLLFFFLSSCSADAVPIDSTGYFENGLWSQCGSIPNSETTGAAMEWQEFICSILTEHLQNPEKEKLPREPTRQQPNLTEYLELTYPNDSEIIGS